MEMFRLLACLALLGQLHGLSLPELLRIFGGYETPVKGYPFMVNLRRRRQMKCGGFLATPSCVVTAAHCLEERPDRLHDLTVHAQQQCLGDGSASEDVRQACYSTVSPQYSQFNMDADVAVIRLQQPFNISKKSLPQIDFNELPAKANLTVLGWGMTNNYAHHWNQCLQAAHVGLVPQDVCRHVMRAYTVTDNMFCALGENRKDACNYDSGGPILHAGRPVGIVSWGKGCGSGLPGVYTRLSSIPIKNWLRNHIESHCML